MRPLFKLLMLFGMTAYLIFALFTFHHARRHKAVQKPQHCHRRQRASYAHHRKDIDMMLRKASLYPIGRSMKDVDLIQIQNKLQSDPFIREAICMKTPGENVNVFVVQRLPLLRIIADNGEDYYVDSKGYPMAARGYEADLPVVTGQVTNTFVKKSLLPLGMLLSQDEFWNNQVMQIQVQPNQDIDLVLRVGNALVHLGKAENFDQKLNNLRAFYEKVLPNVGWNRYQAISVAYENQVIGIKQEP